MTDNGGCGWSSLFTSPWLQHFGNGGSSINTAPTCLSCIYVDLTIRNASCTILHCIYLCSLDSMYFDVFDCFHDLSIQHDTTTIDVLAEVVAQRQIEGEKPPEPQPLFLGGFLWKWLQLWSCQWTGHLLHFWTIFKRNVTISQRRSKTCFPVCNGVYKNAQEIPLYNSHMQSQSIIFCMAFKLVLLGCL